MTRRSALTLLFPAFVSAWSFAGPSAGAGLRTVGKPLPLDGVPYAVLKERETSEFLPGRVIVKLMPGADPTDLLRDLEGTAVSSLRPMFPGGMIRRNTTSVDLSRFYILRYAAPYDAFSFAEQISLLDPVHYAEPSFIYPISTDPDFTPNDPSFAGQYGLTRIQAPAAWDITQGDTSVIIGIVDSGVEVNHPDLTANIWRNPGENGTDGFGNDRRSNGLDDDGNGYVDDWQGWDFGGADYTAIVPDNNPSPTASNNEHGTHVAGIASASTNNGVGVAGTGFRCRLLAVKTAADNDFRGPGGLGYIIAGYEGVAYAAFMGADVVNCSWGGNGGSQTEQELVTYATELGTLIVAAAGNNASNAPFYPAAYDNVISVAATGSTDVRASFSNYGQTIDVCAPGVSILSTIFPGTYTANYSGTSMASPFAAGAAGLLRAMEPALSARQLGEQLRVTADNIDAANPLYVGQLGKGRINAHTMLTADVPSIRATRLVVRDSAGGNNNGNPEPNETIDLVWTFINFLAPTTNAVATLTTSAPGLTVITGTLVLGAVPTLDTIRNATEPFRILLSGTVTPGLVATLKLTVTDGSYSDFQYFTVVINPTYQTHTANQIAVTMTNNGRIGFNNFPTNTQGIGLIYPAGGQNHLFEGGVLFGTSATKLVNNIRNTGSGQDNDFLARQPYQLISPGVISAQDGSTVFSDSSAPGANRLGIRVRQYSYAFTGPLRDDIVIIRYDVTNMSAVPISNLYAGQFFDWDIATYGSNRTGFDPPRNLSYCWDQSTPSAPYLGVRALDTATSVRGLVNSTGLTPDRASKWSWISGGTSQASAGPADVHVVIGCGPYALTPGETRVIGFALIGGADLAALQLNADAARTAWTEILRLVPVPAPAPQVPEHSALAQNYPNPFNPSTTIRYALPEAAHVRLGIFDALGRQVRTLVDEMKPAGDHSILFEADGLASGVYLYRLDAGGFRQTRRMILVR